MKNMGHRGEAARASGQPGARGARIHLLGLKSTAAFSQLFPRKWAPGAYSGPCEWAWGGGGRPQRLHSSLSLPGEGEEASFVPSMPARAQPQPYVRYTHSAWRPDCLRAACSAFSLCGSGLNTTSLCFLPSSLPRRRSRCVCRSGPPPPTHC